MEKAYLTQQKSLTASLEREALQKRHERDVRLRQTRAQAAHLLRVGQKRKVVMGIEKRARSDVRVRVSKTGSGTLRSARGSTERVRAKSAVKNEPKPANKAVDRFPDKVEKPTSLSVGKFKPALKEEEEKSLAAIKPDEEGHRIDEAKSKKATGFFQPANRSGSTDTLVANNNIKRLLDGLVKKCD